MSSNFKKESNGKNEKFTFYAEKPPTKTLNLTIYKSDHANEKFITLKINEEFYEMYPSQLAHYDGKYYPLQDDKLNLVRRGGKGGIWTGDHYKVEFKEKSVILTKDSKYIDQMKVKYPLNVEVFGGAMMMERMDIEFK